jgi:hypothetical protein
MSIEIIVLEYLQIGKHPPDPFNIASLRATLRPHE